MREEGRISAFQAMVYQISVILATLILFHPGITAMQARQDAWIAALIALFSALLVVFMAAKLALRFPDESVIQYAPRVMGWFFGKLAGLSYIFLFFWLAYYVQRQFGELMTTAYFPLTPNIVFILIITLLAAYMVYAGLEVLCRVALLWGIFVPAFFLLFMFIAKDINIGHFLPVLENGIGPAVAGSLLPGATMAEAAVILILMPFISDKRRAVPASLAAVAAVFVVFSIILVGSVGSFGADQTGRLLFPGFTLYRRLNIPALPVLERLDALYMAIWVGGMLLKLATLFYAGMLGLGQWLGLKSHRPLIFPMGALLVALSVRSWDNVVQLVNFTTEVAPFVVLSVTAVITGITLIVAVLRGMRGGPEEGGGKRASAADKKA
jgi:spore germination protein KB